MPSSPAVLLYRFFLVPSRFFLRSFVGRRACSVFPTVFSRFSYPLRHFVTPPLTPFRQIFSEKKFDEILRKILQDRHRRHIRFARQGDPPDRRFCIYSFTKCSIRKGKNFFEKVRKKYLLFCRNIVQYACKSNGDMSPKRFARKYAHHFPPYHIGSALGAVRFRGRYPFSALRPALPGIGATFPPGRRFLYRFVHKMFDTKRKKFF